MTDRERQLDVLRPVAFAIAYRMLGSVSEAEDVTQETLLRLHQALDSGRHASSATSWQPGSSRPRNTAISPRLRRCSRTTCS